MSRRRFVAPPLVPFFLLSLACCTKKQPDAPLPAGGDASASGLASARSDGGQASNDIDASTPKIGEAGGVVDAEGVRVTIPEGAVRTAYAYAITKVTGEALKDWPRGTEAGFVFEPAGKRFRVPATIALPHPEGGGEVMCVLYDGERLEIAVDEPGGPLPAKPFAFPVVELPRRCAVYSLEHAKAHRAMKEKESAVVAKHNTSFKWEIKGRICDPHRIVRPNAGKDLREPPGISGCPPGMAPIPGRPTLCIDRWEAHLVELLDDGTERTWTPYFNPGAIPVKAKSAPKAVPQGYVSQVQSAKACAAAGKRLCRDDEWVTACKGAKRTLFPYGKEEKRGTCNDHRDAHPAAQYLESADLSVFTKLEHPCISQVPDSLLPAGTKPGCATPEGIFDIVGNLHEWTADPAGTFRGGYYVDTWLNGRGCDYVTTRHDAAYWDYSIGFRCCAEKK